MAPVKVFGIVAFGEADWNSLGSQALLGVGIIIVIYLALFTLGKKPETPSKSSSSSSSKTKKSAVPAPAKKTVAAPKNSRARSKSPAPVAKRAPSPKATPPKAPRANTRGSKNQKNSPQQAGPWSDYDPEVDGTVVKNGIKKSTRRNKGKNPYLPE